MPLSNEMITSLARLRDGARDLRKLAPEVKSRFLFSLAQKVHNGEDEILKANARDLAGLREGFPGAFRDRLVLNPERVGGMIKSLRQVAELGDPVGEVVETKTLDNGLFVRRVRAPLGVIFMIFESRPNVILEAFSLAFKSGNAIVLRGGSESRETAQVIYRFIREALKESALSEFCFLGIDDYDRTLVDDLLRSPQAIDIVVPRGGEALIQHVQMTALMPIIKNDRGLCHTFINADADLKMAAEIVINAKVQRPGVCNSLETVLVHKKVAAEFLPLLYQKSLASRLSWHCDSAALEILGGRANIEAATDKDWDTEHLDLIMNCAVVSDLDAALAHIARHGSKHSEAIITESENDARSFQTEVDAAAVYWNASTRFTDGFELGLGGELGISTQKLHVRGPVGLRELTTPRWVIDGNGQTRK